ncbi:MAG TPA: hypothetical protein VLT33_40310 [Labilithrix sp.]|nr:hypothetical protein [Labilithrix sp.]
MTTALSASTAPSQSRTTAAWLFSRNVDLSVFLGAAVVSFGALGIGALTGALHEETPLWAWVPAIVLCDVAHVWSTVFRTYLDPAERRARPRLLLLAPILGLAASALLFALGELAFWRALAYLAIFHFVRQQYGWVSLYRSRAGETGTAGRVVDTVAIYAATLWPLLHWHTHLPRRFSWFVANDIVALPAFVLPAATVLYVAALGAYVLRAIAMWARGTPNPGKDIVVVTTAAAWYVGIVAFDSDYAFTVTNVFMHGIPYFALVFVHARARSAAAASASAAPEAPSLAARLTRSVVPFLGVLWLIAFTEELFWDRAVWHDRGALFGEPWDVGPLKLLIVPLLALPQLTHYVLDGFIWRRRSNPSVATLAAPQATLSTSRP